jgi:hypothetical protein
MTKNEYIRELRARLGEALALLKERDRRNGSTPTSEQVIADATAALKINPEKLK